MSDGCGIDMFGVESITQSRDTRGDFVKLNAFLASVYHCSQYHYAQTRSRAELVVIHASLINVLVSPTSLEDKHDDIVHSSLKTGLMAET